MTGLALNVSDPRVFDAIFGGFMPSSAFRSFRDKHCHGRWPAVDRGCIG
ncbi:hypothetical protein [Agrobacterium burrii]|nr:hypothetical protein [Agrobacterium burrii]